MKKSQFAVFLTIVLSVYTFVNLIIYLTGLHALPRNLKLAYTVAFLFLFSAYIIGRFAERKLLNAFSAFFVWIGSFWLAAMVYYLLFVLVIYFLRLLNLFLGIIPEALYNDEYKLIIFLSVNFAVILITASGFLNASNPVIRKLNIKINKKAGSLSSLRIAMASDLHLGTIINRKRLKKIVSKINSVKPDIILLPGDVVDEDIGPVIKQNSGELLRTLKAKFGVFAVTGNHEYIGGAEQACKYLNEHGIIVLRDQYVKINDAFYIAGREDRASKGFAGILRKPLGDIIEGIDMSLPVILMDHQPAKLIEAEENGIDLQLSGHTHHGQIWPFGYITGKIYEISMGYKLKGKTHYYVSCGVGTWGPPVRTGNRPEIVEINLNF